MGKKLDKIIESNRKKAEQFTEDQIAMIMSMEEAARKTQNPDTAIKYIIDTLSYFGIEADITSEKGGYPLDLETPLTGKHCLGNLHIMRTAELSDQEEEFFREYALRAALVYAHAEQKVELGRLHGIFPHEVRNAVQTIMGFSSLLLNNRNEFPPEEIDEYLQRIYAKGEQIHNLTGIIDLNGATVEEMRKKEEEFNLDELAAKIAKSFCSEMSEKGIGLALCYTPLENGHIPLVFNKAIMSAVWSTITANALAYTMNTMIYQGIRVKGETLEIQMENQHNGEIIHHHFGMGQGRGFPLVRNIMDKVNGTMRVHNKAYFDPDEYGTACYYGASVSHDPDLKYFNLTLRIPMKELRYGPGGI